ncbi:hypothetical protein RCL1_007687 [Eukaryota sp. TZLM3-RCL]
MDNSQSETAENLPEAPLSQQVSDAPTSWYSFTRKKSVQVSNTVTEIKTVCAVQRCRFTYNFKDKLYTSSIISHCQSHASVPAVLSLLKKSKKTKYYEAQGTTRFTQQSLKPQVITHKWKNLLKLIVNGDQPFSLVEEEDGRNFCFDLNPSIEIPCRKTLRKEIIKVHSSLKNYLKDVLNNASGKFNVTTDGWTSLTGSHYFGITVHFLHQWALRSYVIGFVHLSENHTAINIADLLVELFKDFEIQERILSVTIDNAANMKAAMDILVYRGIIKFLPKMRSSHLKSNNQEWIKGVGLC